MSSGKTLLVRKMSYQAEQPHGASGTHRGNEGGESYRIPTPGPADVKPVGHWNHPGDFLMQNDRFLGSLCYHLNGSHTLLPHSYVDALTLYMTIF